MLQKGQITKHEWSDGHKWFSTCIHCECFKVSPTIGRDTFYPKGHPENENGLREEPQCITRHPEQEAGKV